MTTRPAAESAIYDGWLRHRRSAPKEHAFRYRLFMLYLDLDEIDGLFARRWLWSVGRRNLAEFRRGDYHGDPSIPLDQAVRDTVASRLGRRPDGPIRLLTHLRYFGHCFNPVSFYYGFCADGRTLDWIMAEITNTPWQERHVYVMSADDAGRRGDTLHWQFAKNFHVSPFMPMACEYRWRFQVPADALRVHMNVQGDAHAFDATLVLKRRPITGRSLAWALVRHPALTVRIVVGIHWQALRLWLKRLPVFTHPARHQREHRS
jgi:DUF1365 family protein